MIVETKTSLGLFRVDLSTRQVVMYLVKFGKNSTHGNIMMNAILYSASLTREVKREGTKETEVIEGYTFTADPSPCLPLTFDSSLILDRHKFVVWQAGTGRLIFGEP
jgi:hypothetical protein